MPGELDARFEDFVNGRLSPEEARGYADTLKRIQNGELPGVTLGRGAADRLAAHPEILDNPPSTETTPLPVPQGLISDQVTDTSMSPLSGVTVDLGSAPQAAPVDLLAGGAPRYKPYGKLDVDMTPTPAPPPPGQHARDFIARSWEWRKPAIGAAVTVAALALAVGWRSFADSPRNAGSVPVAAATAAPGTNGGALTAAPAVKTQPAPSGPYLRLTGNVAVDGPLSFADTKCYLSGIGIQWNATTTMSGQRIDFAAIPDQSTLGGPKKPLVWIHAVAPDIWFNVHDGVEWDASAGMLRVTNQQVLTGNNGEGGSPTGMVSFSAPLACPK